MPEGMALNLGVMAGTGEAQPTVATAEELEKLRRVFQKIDEDGSGTIEATELKDMLEMMGQQPTDHQINTMLQLADKDNSGSIDFDEFCMIYGKCSAEAKEDARSEVCVRLIRSFVSRRIS